MSYLLNMLSCVYFEIMLYRYTYAHYENSCKLFIVCVYVKINNNNKNKKLM